jgi:hypothetical protein
MTKETETSISRRKLLARIGLAAGAVYIAPSVTSLGMAHASAPSAPSRQSRPSRQTRPTRPTRPSRQSRISRSSGSSNGNNNSRVSRVYTSGSIEHDIPGWFRRMTGQE